MSDVSRYRALRRTLITLMWIAIVLVYLFPYTWIVMTGFRNPIDTLTMPPRLVFSPTLDGFRYIFTNIGFQHYLFNSIVVSVSATTLVIVIASLAAYALAHLTARRGFLLTILITRMVPGVAVVIPFYLVTSKLGQLDTYRVLIIIFTAFNLPFAIWLLRSFFREIVPELREAAIIDGCSELKVFTSIMVPLSMGGIIATGVFVFIATWNEFLFALVLTNSRVPTAPLAILGFRTEYGTQWGAIGAAALLISTPVIVFAILMQKYLVRGLTMGSVR